MGLPSLVVDILPPPMVPLLGLPFLPFLCVPWEMVGGRGALGFPSPPPLRP